MKTKIIWFVIGFVVSWLTWSVISYVRLCPRNYTHYLPESQKKLFQSMEAKQPGCNWLKSALARRLGNFEVLVSPTSSNATIYPLKSDHYPQVVFMDNDGEGEIETIVTRDAAHRTISIDDKDGDGVFDSFSYSTGEIEDKDSICYTDNNMDGQYDVRFGPGNTSSVFVDSQWHALIIKDKKRYVDINSTITQVKVVNGVWRVVEE